MTVMQSIITLGQTMVRLGFSHLTARRYTCALVTHATMCRARADSAAGALRDFIRVAADMTRIDAAPSEVFSAAACEALHDLIMEGVQ